METTDFQKGRAWLIMPEAFELIARKFAEADIADHEKNLLTFTERTSDGGDLYSLDGGVATIRISGPLSKRMSFFSFFMGGETYAFIEKAFNAALNDVEVDAIVLDIDSPGGTVSGTESISELIFNSRGKKPIVAFANGTMASAAYWIGSSADMIIGELTADVGSIGVLMIHEDWSKWESDKGIKTTYITAGKYKALGNDSEPLNDFARNVFQKELDYLYTIFTETVARNRDVETETVLSKMADGRIFIGQQAVDVGLIDRIGNLKTAIDEARTLADSATNSRRGVFKMSKEDLQIENIEQLAAMFPRLVNEIRDASFAEGSASVDISEAITDAESKERDRVLGLVSAKFGEEEGEKFSTLVSTGVTVDQFKAISDAAPAKEQDDKSKILDEITKAGADNPGSDHNADIGTGGKDFMMVAREYQRQNKCSLVEAMKHVQTENPDLHKEYIKSVN